LRSTLFPYTTLFRSRVQKRSGEASLILAADRWLELSASTDSHTSTRSTRATGHLHLRRKPTGRYSPVPDRGSLDQGMGDRASTRSEERRVGKEWRAT